MSVKLKIFAQNNKQLLGMLLAIAILFIILSFTVKDFMTFLNMTNLLAQVAPIAIMTSGVTFVLITRGIDISSPAVMAASAVLGVFFMTSTSAGNLVIGTIIILAAGALFGLINGAAIAKLKMVPLVVTLSMMTIATGLATAVGGGSGLPTLPPTYAGFFNKYTVIVMLFVIPAILDFVLKGTAFGRQVYYIGNNKNTARISGINTDKVIMSVYIISSLCAGIAGIINVASVSTARAAMGTQSQILDILSAAVIGGVSVNGGKGRVRDACFGALLIVGVNNVMNMIGVSDYYTTLIKGSIIIVAMGITSLRAYNLSRKMA